jgi:hypothetical protein
MTMPRRRLLGALAVTAACAVAGSSASPALAKTCSRPDYPGQGYFNKVEANKNISCSGAKAVVLGHYKCRTKKGKKGRCASFNGWSCSERRQAIATEYNAVVKCKKSDMKVVYYYNQDT